MNTALNGDFLQNLVSVILVIFTTITNVILFPINLLINSFFPDFSNALTNISAVFQLGQTYMGWVISFLGVPAVLLSMVLAYYLFVITVTMGIWGVKLAIKWIGHFA